LPAEDALARAERLLLGEVTGTAPLSPAETADLLDAPPSGTREERLAVYSRGYSTRLAEALEGDYPATRRILGAGAFADLVERYVRACPPRSHDLGGAGRCLPRFLETDGPASDLPFLPDLAALERALAEAFVARDAAPLTASSLAAVPCDEVPDLVLSPAPGVEVVRSRWPLLELLRARDLADDEVSVALEGRPTIALVFRRSWAALCDEIDEDEAALVEASRWGGVTLAELQSRAERHDDAEGAARLASAFARLVARGAFTATTRSAADSGAPI